MGPGEPPPPAERLSPGVRWLWRLRLLIAAAALLVAGLAASGPLDGTLATVAATVPWLLALAAAAVVPGLRYARWRFAVQEEEIDLRHGGLVLRRTLVPMRRVQHVDSSSGLLEQALDLATVTVHTAGGSVEIPGLERSRAWAVHQRIAALARLTDDD
jgi:membrane protein YdbS with pleckstrin-like domain